jgi:hypothetical protein
MNKLMIIEEMKDQKGRVAAEEKATNHPAMTSLRPLPTIRPIKPPYRGNCRAMGPPARAVLEGVYVTDGTPVRQPT